MSKGTGDLHFLTLPPITLFSSFLLMNMYYFSNGKNQHLKKTIYEHFYK